MKHEDEILDYENADIYGRKLEIVNAAGVGGCLDAAAEGNLLYIIGVDRSGPVDPVNYMTSFKTGCIHIADISDQASPKVISQLRGLGNARQIEVRDGIAYVASREDGLFILDASEPANPRLLSHYDTVEFATGIDICGKFAYVSCRVYGVEIIDVSDPSKPSHVSIIRMGEAQSVDVREGYLYAGVWGQQNLTVCDVRNPYEPRIVAVMPVDGRGDGVFVKGRYCYVATGHHARGMVVQSPEDPAFGAGNGLEIFDISDPEKPVFVSRIKINRFYKLGNDMWDVMVYGKYAFLSHTYNGIFVIDISDPHAPFFAARARLPLISVNRQELNPVGGMALGEGCIYAAGIYSDLYVADAAGLAGRDSEACEAGTGGAMNAAQAAAQPAAKQAAQPVSKPAIHLSGRNIPSYRIYKPEGQVHAAAIKDGVVFAACGSGGVHVLDISNHLSLPRKIAAYATDGIAFDIKIAGDTVYVAEGSAGLSIWHLSGGCRMERAGCYNAYGNTISNVIAVEGCRYIMLQLGSRWLHIVDAAQPSLPKLVLSDCPDKGLIYGRQMGNGLLNRRYGCCFWHVAGMFWYDIAGDGITCDTHRPVYSGYSQQQRMSQANGLAFAREGTAAVLTHNRGYVVLDYKYGGNLNDLPHIMVKGHDLTGKPSVSGDMLFISNRIDGAVTILDIADLESPKVITGFNASGSPEVIVREGGITALPTGYEGLMLLDL